MRMACIALLLVVVSLVPQEADALSLPRVEARWDSDEPVAVGRPVTLVVNVDHEAGSTIHWPKVLGLGKEIEERARQILPTVGVGGILHTRAEFVIMAFDAGTLEIPAIEVGYTGPRGESRTLLGPALSLQVSGTVNTDNPVLRPMASTRPAPVRDWYALALMGGGGLGLVLVTAALGHWRRKRRGVAEELAVSRSSPHEEALASLQAIEASGRIDGDALKPVFHEMSEIVRGYLGRRFEFPALDLTSSEIEARLERDAGSQMWCNAVIAWLSTCDLVKYAGSQVTGDEARTTLYRARLLIERPGDEWVSDDSARRDEDA